MQIQLHAQMLRLVFAQIRHGYRRVRRATGRVNVDRAHTEQTLQKRSVLVNRLNALVGHMHALLVEDARIQAEFLIAQLVPQVLVRPPLVQQAQQEDHHDDRRDSQTGDHHDESVDPARSFKERADHRGEQRDAERHDDDAGTLDGLGHVVGGQGDLHVALALEPEIAELVAAEGDAGFFDIGEVGLGKAGLVPEADFLAAHGTVGRHGLAHGAGTQNGNRHILQITHVHTVVLPFGQPVAEILMTISH